MAGWNVQKQACGDRIRSAREQHGWNITELSVQADVSAEQISRYENGMKLPGYETLVKIASALQLPLSAFQPAELDAYGGCSPEEAMLLAALRELSPLKRRQACSSMQALLEMMK